jgi:hypothetical protein
MKRLLLVLLAGVAAVALYATTAPAGQQAVTPNQFAALSKKVTTLQKDVKTLKAAVACFAPVGIAQFGDGSSAGYHYKQPDGTEVLASAIDATGQNEQPGALMAIINPQCVQQGSFRRLAHIGPAHRLGR